MHVCITCCVKYEVSQHFRLSGIYWGLTAMCVMGRDIQKEMKSDEIVAWVLRCQDRVTGGFGGSIGHDSHLLYTLSALQILAITQQLHKLDNVDKICSFIASLQREDGSFAGDKWGEIDTRFSYCALSALAILGQLDNGHINKTKALQFVRSCRNFDGGFGAVPGGGSTSNCPTSYIVFICISMDLLLV